MASPNAKHSRLDRARDDGHGFSALSILYWRDFSASFWPLVHLLESQRDPAITPIDFSVAAGSVAGSPSRIRIQAQVFAHAFRDA